MPMATVPVCPCVCFTLSPDVSVRIGSEVLQCWYRWDDVVQIRCPSGSGRHDLCRPDDPDLSVQARRERRAAPIPAIPMPNSDRLNGSGTLVPVPIVQASPVQVIVPFARAMVSGVPV